MVIPLWLWAVSTVLVGATVMIACIAWAWSAIGDGEIGADASEGTED